MTLPDERYRAMKWAREFLQELLDPSKTPRIPRAIRKRAYSVLKHYPWDSHIENYFDLDITKEQVIINRVRSRTSEAGKK